MNEKEFNPLKEMTVRICTDLPQQHATPSTQHSKAAASSAKSTLAPTVEERYTVGPN